MRTGWLKLCPIDLYDYTAGVIFCGIYDDSDKVTLMTKLFEIFGRT